jgi:hypothetical protein
MKYLVIAAILAAPIFVSPASADEVGVHVGPVGAGVTVGEAPDRDRDRDRTTVIKKERDDGSESKTIIHHDN